MARPKEFQRDEVLEKAMAVFWSKGYECTSVQDLVDAMGINRGSLYDTFGDKQSLHVTVLERFYETELPIMFASLDGPGLSQARHPHAVQRDRRQGGQRRGSQGLHDLKHSRRTLSR